MTKRPTELNAQHKVSACNRRTLASAQL